MTPWPKELGQDNVFMDVDTIDIGVEFRDAIESGVTSCDVLFAMIGPRWLTVGLDLQTYVIVCAAEATLGPGCRRTGADPEIIGVLAGPGVAHFCGHRIAPMGMTGRFPADAEEEVAARIDAELASDTPRYAYGSLASGADILWAERCARAGRSCTSSCRSRVTPSSRPRSPHRAPGGSTASIVA
jgi:hypothetical protein